MHTLGIFFHFTWEWNRFKKNKKKDKQCNPKEFLFQEEEEEVPEPEEVVPTDEADVGTTPVTAASTDDTGNAETGSPRGSRTASASPTPTSRLRWLPGLM